MLLLTLIAVQFLIATLEAQNLTASISAPLEDSLHPEGFDYFFGNQGPVPDTHGVFYKGGRLLVDPITVYLIWFGHWPEKSKTAVRNAISSLSAASNSGQPDLQNWWKLTSQFTDAEGRPVTSSVSLSSVECSTSLTQNVNRNLVTSVVRQAFNVPSAQENSLVNCTPSTLPQDASAVYHLLFSRDVVHETQDFARCTRRFSLIRLTDDGPEINMAWSSEPQKLQFCGLWNFGEFLTPEDKLQLDSLIGFVLAQTVAQATNTDFQGWQTRFGAPVTSMCMSPTGLTNSKMDVVSDYENLTSWNLYGINNYRYLVQQIWYQKDGYCALQPLGRCDDVKYVTGPSGTISYGVVVNHSVGLQGYGQHLRCRWSVSSPEAYIIRLSVNFQHLARIDDELKVFACGESKQTVGRMSRFLQDPEELSCIKKVYIASSEYPQQLEMKSREFSLVFTTGLRAPFFGKGWEVEYKTGYCDGIVTPVNTSGVLTDGSPVSANYLDNHKCGWLLDAEEGARVALEFTRFDTVAGKDRLTVYSGVEPKLNNILRVYEGSYSTLPRETFPGPVLLVFSTETSSGHGWELKYSMIPGKSSEGADIAVIFAVIGGSIGGMVVAGLIITFFFKVYVQNKESELTKPLIIPSSNVLTRNAVVEATEDFSGSNLIANGSRASVFKGILDGQKVVVKSSLREMMINELLVLSIASKHAGIVGFIGYCLDRDEGFLVLENAVNGSLAENLFSGSRGVLGWETRLRIALQVATALEYLHGYVEPCIVHGNISSDNVLLDSRWNAKLAGFGSSSTSCAQKVGSQNFKLRAEDVYRFGGLVLELVMGEPAWETNGRGRTRSVKAVWACGVIGDGDAAAALDTECPENADFMRAVVKMAEVGAWCMNERVRERPTMVEVASALRQVVAISLRRSR